MLAISKIWQSYSNKTMSQSIPHINIWREHTCTSSPCNVLMYLNISVVIPPITWEAGHPRVRAGKTWCLHPACHTPQYLSSLRTTTTTTQHLSRTSFNSSAHGQCHSGWVRDPTSPAWAPGGLEPGLLLRSSLEPGYLKVTWRVYGMWIHLGML